MYNPTVSGYSKSSGPFLLPLEVAKSRFGDLPSSYLKELEREVHRREPKKALNLELGVDIKEWLTEDKTRDLKEFVLRFCSSWHRDYEGEFGISTRPLHNLNDKERVNAVIARNRATLDSIFSMDVREAVSRHKLLRKDVLNSIAPEKVVGKAVEVVRKKLRTGGASLQNEQLFSQLRVRQILDDLRFSDVLERGVAECADEVAKALFDISRLLDLPGGERLSSISGSGIEFKFAPRDHTYLELGRFFGDCTSDKKNLQFNCQAENIYWTVFSWLLDCNYQILLATVDGRPVIKCHILPLLVDVPQTGQEPYFFLFIDAIETVPQLRLDDRTDVDDSVRAVLDALINKVLQIADGMGIDAVYTERFSNTAWVRHELKKFPEIYLDTKRIGKIDELEDVFFCASAFCRANQYRAPEVIFMELQARNTYLIAETIIGSYKSFGVIRGDSGGGLPMKVAFGV